MMKTIKRLSVSTVLGLLALAMMVACEKNGIEEKDGYLKIQPEDCFPTSITGIDVPDLIEAGKPASFLVHYEMPNPCCEFSGFHFELHSDTLVVITCIHLNEDACIQVIAPGTDEFKKTFPMPGNYFMRYYYYGEKRTIELEVH